MLMAGWLRFSNSVVICLLASQIAAHLLVNAPKLPMNGSLPFLLIAQDQSRPQIDAAPSQQIQAPNLQKWRRPRSWFSPGNY